MSLPWFRMDNSRWRAHREQHRYTPEAPACDLLALGEFSSIVATGDVERWSLTQLAQRWCWGRKRVKRLIQEWAADAQEHGWDGHVLDLSMTVEAVLARFDFGAPRPGSAPGLPRKCPGVAPAAAPRGGPGSAPDGSRGRPGSTERFQDPTDTSAPEVPRVCPGDAPATPRSRPGEETHSRPASCARAPARSSSESEKETENNNTPPQGAGDLAGQADRAEPDEDNNQPEAPSLPEGQAAPDSDDAPQDPETPQPCPFDAPAAPRQEGLPLVAKAKPPETPEERIYARWASYSTRRSAVPTPARLAELTKALEWATEAQWLALVDWLHIAPECAFHRGANPTGAKYLGLANLLVKGKTEARLEKARAWWSAGQPVGEDLLAKEFAKRVGHKPAETAPIAKPLELLIKLAGKHGGQLWGDVVAIYRDEPWFPRLYRMLCSLAPEGRSAPGGYGWGRVAGNFADIQLRDLEPTAEIGARLIQAWHHATEAA